MSSDAFTLAVMARPDADSSGEGIACQCQGCHAPTPTSPEVEVDPLATPDVPITVAAVLVSILREPLVPPPQPDLRRA